MIEDKFERKLKEMFKENFRVARNKVKQQRERLVIALRNKLHRNGSTAEGRKVIFSLVVIM